ncbi:unannotated protein [freshwater metagenome]|uniref:Unannotated protein n=1 Tax=freshwater metagenome TaxID=449393 RepID=A0A6J7XNV2_9ZZZZ
MHPLTWWIWAICLAVASARFKSLALSLVVVLLVASVVYSRNEKAPWSQTFGWSLKIAVWVIGIRMAIAILIGVPVPGNTVFTLPIIPMPNWIAGIRLGGPVTSERLILTAHEAIAMACIIVLLGAASSLTSPHQLLRVLPLVIYEFGVALVIATSVVPQLVISYGRIREAHFLRGATKISFRKIALPLMEESLARSLDLAAAMDSRGYGISAKRSRYRPTSFTMADKILIALSLTTFFFAPLTLIAAIAPHILAQSFRNTA